MTYELDLYKLEKPSLDAYNVNVYEPNFNKVCEAV